MDCLWQQCYCTLCLSLWSEIFSKMNFESNLFEGDERPEMTTYFNASDFKCWSGNPFWLCCKQTKCHWRSSSPLPMLTELISQACAHCWLWLVVKGDVGWQGWTIFKFEDDAHTCNEVACWGFVFFFLTEVSFELATLMVFDSMTRLPSHENVVGFFTCSRNTLCILYISGGCCHSSWGSSFFPAYIINLFIYLDVNSTLRSFSRKWSRQQYYLPWCAA